MLFSLLGIRSRKVSNRYYLETNAFWRLLHMFAFLVCLGFVTFLFLEDFIGLNLFGFCGITALFKQ